MAVIHPKQKKNLNSQLKLSTTRIPVYLWIGTKSPQEVSGYVMGADVRKKGVVVYLKDKVPKGEVCMIAFQEKKSQPFRAIAAFHRSIKEKRNSHVKGASWQIGLQFEFASQDESKRFEAYLKGLLDDVSSKALPDKAQPVMVEATEEVFDWDDDDVA